MVAILTRAEPVDALYEQRKMHHVDPHGDMFKILEAQMCEFVPRHDASAGGCQQAGMDESRQDGYAGIGRHEVFLKDRGAVDYSMFTRELLYDVNQRDFRGNDRIDPGPERGTGRGRPVRWVYQVSQLLTGRPPTARILTRAQKPRMISTIATFARACPLTIMI